MESFSLLNYWRGTGGPSAADARTTTIAASVFRPSGETDTEDDDEGPFFDLEFALPDSDSDGVVVVEDIKTDDSTVNSDSDEEKNDSHRHRARLSLSPAVDSKLEPFQLPVFLLRSATKLRVLMLRFRRPKPDSGNAPVAPAARASSKFFIKVEEVPIVSLFTRGNSSRDTNRPATKKSHSDDDDDPAAAERRVTVTKEVVQKYLNKIKPLYSKRYGERLRFSGLLNSEAVVGKPVAGSDKKGETQSAVFPPMGLRVVGKRFGKSRSAPLAVALATVPPPPQDDSLWEKQDGIQSAIAHCKRSFNGMDPVAAGSASPLVRSTSDPSG